MDCSFARGVPHSIGSLPRLTYLDLSGNNFTGLVDFQTFSTQKNLRFLGLSGVSVSGQDATDANHMFPKLERLDLWATTLINFPCFLSSMPELMELYVSESVIREFPGQCVNNDLSFPQLQRLDMFSCNLTKFPYFLSRSNKLRYLGLNGNMIEQIPSWFWGIRIDTLEELYLGDNLIRGELRLPWKGLAYPNLRNNSFNGSISLSICQLTHLRSLELRQNNLTGVITQCIGNLTDLRYLDLFSNSLTGPLPLPSTGEINSLICNATNLRSLDLSNNSLTGTLPHCLKNVTIQLFSLNLRASGFQGSTPEIFHEQSSLRSLDFSRNQFKGSLPRSLSNCKCLQVLDIGRNKMGDSFPDWLGDLALKVLSLRSNKFRGNLSVSQGTRLFSELRILDLSNNGFKGNLSDNLISEMFGMARGDGGNATRDMTFDGISEYYSVMIDLKGVEMEVVKIYIDFATLDLSSNRFCGEIPRNIGLLKITQGA